MLNQLLQIHKSQTLKSYTTTKEWATEYFQQTENKTPIEKAIFGGFATQQLSFAFLAGYQAALEKMFPSIAPNKIKALCISEAKGGHPKAIETTLIDNQINGLKTYITAGTEVEHLLVLCKTDEVVNNRPLLKMVHLPNDAENTTITNFELPFMKDIKHGKLALNNTKIESYQILEGDGFSEYTRPFRTLEDICVGAAQQAMLLRQAIQNQWDESLRDKLYLNIFTLKNLLDLPLNAPETILLVATYQQQFEQLLPTLDQQIATNATPQFQADWAMNKRLFSMGKKLREIRLAKVRKVFFE